MEYRRTVTVQRPGSSTNSFFKPGEGSAFINSSGDKGSAFIKGSETFSVRRAGRRTSVTQDEERSEKRKREASTSNEQKPFPLYVKPHEVIPYVIVLLPISMFI